MSDKAIEEDLAAGRSGARSLVMRARENLRNARAADQDDGDLLDGAPYDHTTPLRERPFVKAGAYSWAGIGMLALAALAVLALLELRIVVIPLVLALFPAAVLMPPNRLLKRYMPSGLASFLVVLGFFGLLAGVVAILAPSVSDEVGSLDTEVQAGADQLQDFLADGPFGFQPVQLDELVANARERFLSGDGLASVGLGAATVVAEGFAALALLLFALFFYLKDGPKIARWMRNLFPVRVRDDVEAMGYRSWQTIGAYIRGQLFIALVDATLIGIGIAVLGVPLALPLSVLVFFGGLFPIVGAFLSGGVAVLVALATTDPTTALILLAVIVAVQQLEGHILAPVVLGRAVELHPLAAVAALTAGAVLLGVLGAFLSIPIAASLARAAGYLRTRTPG